MERAMVFLRGESSWRKGESPDLNSHLQLARCWQVGSTALRSLAGTVFCLHLAWARKDCHSPRRCSQRCSIRQAMRSFPALASC